jgi:hypothetical protein
MHHLSLRTHGLLLSRRSAKGRAKDPPGLTRRHLMIDPYPSRTVPVFAFGSIMDWRLHPFHGHPRNAPAQVRATPQPTEARQKAPALAPTCRVQLVQAMVNTWQPGIMK